MLRPLIEHLRFSVGASAERFECDGMGVSAYRGDEILARIELTAGSVSERIAAAAIAVAQKSSADPVEGQPSRSDEVIHDVARFESSRQFYAAVIAERGLDMGLSQEARETARSYCRQALQPYAAADDTLCVPLEARLV